MKKRTRKTTRKKKQVAAYPLIIKKLQQGEPVARRAARGSLGPNYGATEPYILRPITVADVQPGDLIYCRYGIYHGIRLVVAIDDTRGCQVVAPATGEPSGWTLQIYGKVHSISTIPDENAVSALVSNSGNQPIE